MLGNVWEWTCSEDDQDYGGDESRCAVQQDGRHVLRGGSWASRPDWVRSAYRSWGTPDARDYDIGFRLARTN